MSTLISVIPEAPLLGSLPALLIDNLALRRRISRRDPDISLIHVGPRPAIVIGNADYCQEVLLRLDDFDKPAELTDVARPVFGLGLLAIENRRHRAHRRIVQPAFNHSNLTRYAATMVEYTEATCARWRPGMVVDIGQEMMALTMRIIGKIMFDVADLGNQDALGRDITTALQYVSDAFLLPLPLAWPLPRNLRVKRALARLDTRISQMVAACRRAGGDRGQLLALLLAARDETGQGLSDQQIRDEAMTTFLAGHETTALALTWSFYLLSRHPATYARVRREVTATLQGRTPTVADLPNLPYTLQVFKEALRLYPPAHTVVRLATRDTEIGGRRVPKGALVLLDIYSMQRRTDYFPRPAAFDPERFSPEREKAIPRNAYQPFGSGPRSCIGRPFALMEGHLILATISDRVRLERTDATRIAPKAALTLRPRRPVVVRIRAEH
jgi:cytochrome P450